MSLAQAYLPDKIETIFIYLTSREMASYFSNTANGLAEFYNLSPGTNLRIHSNYLDLRAGSLRSAAGAVIPAPLASCSPTAYRWDMRYERTRYTGLSRRRSPHAQKN